MLCNSKFVWFFNFTQNLSGMVMPLCPGKCLRGLRKTAIEKGHKNLQAIFFSFRWFWVTFQFFSALHIHITHMGFNICHIPNPTCASCIMATSLAPSPIAAVVGLFSLFLTNFTIYNKEKKVWLTVNIIFWVTKTFCYWLSNIK